MNWSSNQSFSQTSWFNVIEFILSRLPDVCFCFSISYFACRSRSISSPTLRPVYTLRYRLQLQLTQGFIGFHWDVYMVWPWPLFYISEMRSLDINESVSNNKEFCHSHFSNVSRDLYELYFLRFWYFLVFFIRFLRNSWCPFYSNSQDRISFCLFVLLSTAQRIFT